MGDESLPGGLKELTVFLDENHCGNRHLIAVLDEAKMAHESYLDHFARGAPDVEWLPVIAAWGWILLTADARIRSKRRVNLLERRAIEENAIRMFYFSTNQSSGWEMGQALQRAIPKMIELCKRHEAPFTASINKSGEVTLRDTFRGDAWGQEQIT